MNFYYSEKLRADKLASLGCIFLLVFENVANKVFDINTEYMKYVNKFWREIYSENCQLFEPFYRLQFTLMYRFFCASQPAQ